MLPKMRYRLGLDLGTTSIGWCMIRLDKNSQPVAIIRMGTRIFSDGRNPKDRSSLAVTRREARQARRRRDRLLKRKARMLSALIRLGFFPQDEQKRRELVKLDPYALRKKGLYQALAGPEFARALFHLNQRRGFKSNRKTDKKDSDSGMLKKAIKDLRVKLVEEDCETLGEWLANRHAEGLSVRARLRGSTQKDKAYDFYADRTMVEHEFDQIWSKQSQINPALFTEKARDELKDILLFQRNLKPVKPGRCTLMPEEERAPLALPSVQRFRIYQEVNNLRVLHDDLTEKSPLTLEQRNAVVEFLETGKAATFKTKIRGLLELPAGTKFNLEDIKRDRLKGNATSAVLAKPEHFGKEWHKFDLPTQNEIVKQLLTEASEPALVDWLTTNSGVTEECAEAIANAGLPEGYGQLSKEALNRILPELVKDVVVYSDAVTRAGFDSHSALSLTQQTGEILPELPYYAEPLQRHVAFGSGALEDRPEQRYGKIANPTVHIGLNELRKVVNALIRRYGHPSEVIIEVTRELKLSKKRKDEINREQAERQSRNQQHVEDACLALQLVPANLDGAKRRELSQKMQLWTELAQDPCNRRCPYTGEQISIGKLLSSDVEIEHILPFSKTLDDSLNNKTVAMRRANRVKGNRTPCEAFGDDALAEYDYDAILERASLMPRIKARRFAPDAYQNWLREDQDFLARALNDTAYLSRLAKEYLSLICPPNDVRAIPGRMTALLRGKFGLNQLLSGSSMKNRDDHRHHAIDAAVIAVTDQGLLQRFASANASARERQLQRLVAEMPLPWPSYRDQVARGLSNIIVSHRPDHGYQGRMHEDTAWGFRDDGMVTRRKPSEEGGQRTRETKNKQLISITSTGDPHRHGLDEDGHPKAYKGYVGGSNYCIEISANDKGRWQGEVISTFDAYQVVRSQGEVEGIRKLLNPRFTQSRKPLVMRLMINDTVSAGLDNDKKIWRVVKIVKGGQIFMTEHNESNADARNRDRANPFSYLSKMAGSLQKARARHVVVSEIGTVRTKPIRE